MKYKLKTRHVQFDGANMYALDWYDPINIDIHGMKI